MDFRKAMAMVKGIKKNTRIWERVRDSSKRESLELSLGIQTDFSQNFKLNQRLMKIAISAMIHLIIHFYAIFMTSTGRVVLSSLTAS